MAFEALANDRLHSAVVAAVPDMNQFRCALELYHWSLRSAVLTFIEFIEVDHLSCSRPNECSDRHRTRKLPRSATAFCLVSSRPHGYTASSSSALASSDVGEALTRSAMISKTFMPSFSLYQYNDIV